MSLISQSSEQTRLEVKEQITKSHNDFYFPLRCPKNESVILSALLLGLTPTVSLSALLPFPQLQSLGIHRAAPRELNLLDSRAQLTARRMD